MAVQTVFNSFHQWWLPVWDPAAYVAALVAQNPAPVLAQNAESLLNRLAWQLSQRLQSPRMGTHAGVLRGQGLDFLNLREYAPGDDVRKLDWNVYARTQSMFVREYHAEKQLTVWLMVDATGSMRFGWRRTKLQLAIELVGLLGLLASQQGFRVGLLAFNGHTTQVLRPGHAMGSSVGGQGAIHLNRLMHQLLTFCETTPLGPESPTTTGIGDAFEALANLQRHRGFVFVLSDFLADAPEVANEFAHESTRMPCVWEPAFARLCQAHDVLAFHLTDPNEGVWPALADDWPIIDAEEPTQRPVHGRFGRRAKQHFETHLLQQQQAIQSSLGYCQASVKVSTEDDAVDRVINLFCSRPFAMRAGGR